MVEAGDAPGSAVRQRRTGSLVHLTQAIRPTLFDAGARPELRVALQLGQFPPDEWVRIGAIKRVAGERLAGRALSRREVSGLFAACAKDGTPAGFRDAAIIALMVTAGLRRSEVVGIQIGDYQTRTGVLLVRKAKGDHQREIRLTNATRKKITAWLRKRGKGAGPLFCPIGKDGRVSARPLGSQSVYDIVRERTSKARIDRSSPHDLRRTFVTRLLEQGVDLHTVSELAGHKSIQTTARYDRRGERERARAMRWLK